MATLKQKKAIKKAVENGGNISRAMRDAGYSHQTAKNPSKLTESKAWSELIEEYMPDESILQGIHEGFGAMKQIGALVLVSGDKPMKTKDNEGQIEVPDFAVRHKYLETALKLKNKFPAVKQDVTTNGKDLSPVLVQFIDNADNKDSG